MSALARERLWTLLGRLLLEPPIGALGEVARQLPQLEPYLDAADDELAAAHHAAFSLGVPAYASVFLSTDAMLGGDTSAACHGELSAMGASIRSDVDADHFGVLCLAMGFLAGAEADAERDGLEQVVRSMSAHQQQLSQRYLAPCVPAFVIALQREGDGLYAEVAGLLAAMVPDTRAVAEEGSDPLDNPKTGLSAIARWLLTPRHAGWYLTRTRIQAVAASADVPCGFGDRYRMLEGLLKASVDHGQLEDVLRALEDERREWQNQAEALSLRIDALSTTNRLLSTIRTAAGESTFTY